jgi:uncharacterized protein DUF3632
VARITNEGLTPGCTLGLWELRLGLEENATKATANCNVSVASEWIIRSGIRLYSEALNPMSLDEHEMRSERGGPLYNGQVGHCRERWQFWKFRFSKVKDEVDEDVAQMIQQAVDEMERIEKFHEHDRSRLVR